GRRGRTGPSQRVRPAGCSRDPPAPGGASARVQPALGLAASGPAPLAPRARARAVGAADGRVTAVVEPVVRQAAGGDELPDAGLVPVGDRARLPEPMARVEAELRRRRAGGALLAADAGDPAVQPRQRPGERLDL